MARRPERQPNPSRLGGYLASKVIIITDGEERKSYRMSTCFFKEKTLIPMLLYTFYFLL